MKKHFVTIAKTALVLVYLVIIAGATVRMTGSGMGCPDWPKCFGYYIPPTSLHELLWSPNKTFKKGQVIIREERLWIAKETFVTAQEFDASYWENYTRHDYAQFNAVHTWVEYVNRLFGALSGLACLFMGIASFGFWKKNNKVVFFSWIAVFLLGFQAWLGSTVVYSVLNPVKITLHMVVALIILAVLIYNILLAKENTQRLTYTNKNRLFYIVLWISLLLTLIQVALGTQVRQFVDEQIKAGIENKAFWFNNPQVSFYFHRTFSFIVFFANLFLYLRNKRLQLGFDKLGWIMILLLVEIGSGMGWEL